MLDMPPLAIRRVDVGVGCIVVGEVRGMVVPIERLAGEADRNRAEQSDLREATAIVEV